MAELAGDVHDRRREANVAGGAVELRGDAAARLDPAELLEEVDVEVGAAELAVRDTAQPEVFLELHDVANRGVFHRAQLRARDRAALRLLACVQQFLRPEKAADVIGAKRWASALRHGGTPGLAGALW